MDSSNIPDFDLDGHGPPLHFLHANGYPPDCYRPLLRLLASRFHVFGMLLRPLWPESNMGDIQDWHPFSHDLIQFLSSCAPDPVIGVGHSIGGIVTLRAALRDPKRFRAIVLIEPVLFAPPRLLAWALLRAIGLAHRVHPLIAGARKRRKTFDDLQTVFRSYRTRQIFRYMSDEALQTYIAGMTVPKQGGGYRLAYSPEWEAQVYLTGLRDLDLWRDLHILEMPTLILRGAESNTFFENAARLVRRKNPMVRIETVEKATHLLPLERPQQVFTLIQTFLQEAL